MLLFLSESTFPRLITSSKYEWAKESASDGGDHSPDPQAGRTLRGTQKESPNCFEQGTHPWPTSQIFWNLLNVFEDLGKRYDAAYNINLTLAEWTMPWLQSIVTGIVLFTVLLIFWMTVLSPPMKAENTLWFLFAHGNEVVGQSSDS